MDSGEISIVQSPQQRLRNLNEAICTLEKFVASFAAQHDGGHVQDRTLTGNGQEETTLKSLNREATQCSTPAASALGGARLHAAVRAGVLSPNLLPGSSTTAQEEPLAMLSRSQALNIIRVFKLALEDPNKDAQRRDCAMQQQLQQASSAVAALRECSDSLHRDEARVQRWVSAGEKGAAAPAAAASAEGEGDFSAERLLQAWTALRRKGALSPQECAQLGLLTYTRRLQARCDALQSECGLQSASASSARQTASRLRADLQDAHTAVQRMQDAAASREQQLRQGQENMAKLQSALHELQREHNSNTAHLTATHSKHMAEAGVSVATSSATTTSVLSRCSLLQQDVLALRGAVRAARRDTAAQLDAHAERARQETQQLRRALKQAGALMGEAQARCASAEAAAHAAGAKADQWRERHASASALAKSAAAASQEQHALMTQAQEALQQVQDELQSTQGQLRESQKEAAAARKASKSDKSALQQAQSQVKANLQRIAVLEKGVGAARQEAAAADKRCREAQQAAREARAAVTAKAAEASAKYSKLQQDCARHRGHAATLQLQLDRLKNSGAGQRRLAAAAAEAARNAEVGVQTEPPQGGKSSPNSDLQAQLDDAQAARDTLQAQLNDAQAARDTLQSRLGTSSHEAQTALSVLQGVRGRLQDSHSHAAATALAKESGPSSDSALESGEEKQAAEAPTAESKATSDSCRVDALQERLQQACALARAASLRAAQIQTQATEAAHAAKSAALGNESRCRELQLRLRQALDTIEQYKARSSAPARSKTPPRPVSPVGGAGLDSASISVQTSLQHGTAFAPLPTSFLRDSSDEGSLTPRSRPDRSAEWQRRRAAANSEAQVALQQAQQAAQVRKERHAAQVIGAFIAGCGGAAAGGGMRMAVTGVVARRRVAERLRQLRRRVSADQVSRILDSTAQDKRNMGVIARPVSPRDSPAGGRPSAGGGSRSPLSRPRGAPSGPLLPQDKPLA